MSIWTTSSSPQISVDTPHLLDRTDRRICIVLVLCVQAFFLTGVLYGLPQYFDHDEAIFLNAAARMVGDFSLDPGWYGAPAQSLIYLLALGIGLVGAGGMLVGVYDGPGDIGRAFMTDPTPFYVVGRVLSSLFMTGCAVMVYVLLRSLGARRVWAVAGLLMMVVSALVADQVWRVRMDGIQMLANMVGAFLCVRALTSDRPRRLLVAAGACVGLAVSAKYTGVIGAVPVIAAAIVLLVQRRMGLLEAVGALLLAGLASLVAAFVTGPFLFINLTEMLADVAHEARVPRLGHTGTGFIPQLTYYLTNAIPGSMGLPGALAALVGLVLMLRRPGPLIVASFPILYLIFISSLHLQWERWVLPVLPFLAVAVGYALQQLDEKLRAILPVKGMGAPALAGLAAAVLLLPAAIPTARQTMARMENHDTRSEALAWVEANLPQGSRILVETSTVDPAKADYNIQLIQGDRLEGPQGSRVRLGSWFGTHPQRWNLDLPPDQLIQAIRDARTEYVFLGEWIDLYTQDVVYFPRELAVYQAMVAAFPEVMRFTPDDSTLGPVIRVLKVDPQG